MFRHLVQGSLEKLNVRLVTHDPIANGSEVPLLPLLIRGLFGNDHPVTFCQVGANDCSSNDPIQRLIRPNWRGVMIEPQPGAFARVKEKFGSNPRLMLRNCAIADTRGQMTLYTVKDTGGASDDLDGVASFSRDHVLKFVGGDESRVTPINVPAEPLMDLLAEAGIGPEFDLMSIDVEGFDDQVVNMIDLSKVRPSIIQWEHKHVPLARDRECVQWLMENEYKLVRMPLDTIAVDAAPLREWLS